MTKQDAILECISCHDKMSQKTAMKEGWRIVDYTHEIICEMCATTICPLTKEYLE